MTWMKNSSGKPDAMLTCAVVSFGVTTALLIGSVFSGKIELGNISFTISPPDATLVTTYLAACFTSYVIRRNKKDQLESEETQAMLKDGILK